MPRLSFYTRSAPGIYEQVVRSFINKNMTHVIYLQSWTLIICTFSISTGFRTTSEVGGSFYIYKS